MTEAPLITQIRAAAADKDRARKAWVDCCERLDKRIVQAADQGISYRTIGKAAGLSASGVARVLATPHKWLRNAADSPG